MSKQTAAKGISYKSGGEYFVAAADDEIDMDDDQVKAALASGAIKEAAKATKPASSPSASAAHRASDVPK